MALSLLVAMSENRVIGRGGQLPWRLSADLRRFKSLTMGHPIVMGRKTFQSIGRPLPGRTTIVVTRQPGFQAPGARVAHDLEQALEIAASDPETFIVGGAEIYGMTLPRADRLHLTLVHAYVDGDTYFPPLDWNHWHILRTERHSADAHNELDFSFLTCERIGVAHQP